MAYRLTCDVEACGAEIQSGPGQPSLAGKRDVYCPTCTAYIAAVDREMETISNTRGFALVEELNALRREKIAAALPQQLGGAGLQPEWSIVVPEERP